MFTILAIVLGTGPPQAPTVQLINQYESERGPRASLVSIFTILALVLGTRLPYEHTVQLVNLKVT